MKILLVTSFFPPTHNAGTEKRTLGYARTLLERGHSVQVLCAGDWEKGDRYWNGYSDEIFQGIPVRRIHLNWTKSPDPNAYLYNNPEVERFLGGCLSEWQPDLVHITSCLTLSASVIAGAKERNLPIVLTLTDFWFVCHKLSLLKFDGSLCDGVTTSGDCIQCLCWESSAYQKIRRIGSAPVATGVFDMLSRFPALNQRRGLRGMALHIPQRKEFLARMLAAADIVIAPSSHLYQTFRRSGVTREIRVIQSGHDLSWLKQPSVKSHGDRLRFGYIGQFIPTKGVHTLLEAFGSQDWQDKAELHLFGDPTGDSAYWRRLQQIENCNPGKVVFHGPFPHEKLAKILSGLDVLIVPSVWHENNPRVVQEAFAGKTPVIASDVGGISEYVKPEVNGYLFQRGDSQDLQRQIRRLVEDPARLQQLIAGLPEVKKMSNEMDEIESCYQQLLPEMEA